MPRDPKRVWQYFAQALVQEEDPQKITYLTQRLFEALARNDATAKSEPLGFEGPPVKTIQQR